MAKSISDEMYSALMAVADEAVRQKYQPKKSQDEKEDPSEETEFSDDDMAQLEAFAKE